MVAHRVGSFSAFQAEVTGTGGSGSGCYGGMLHVHHVAH